MTELQLFDIPGAMQQGYQFGTQQRLQREGEQRRNQLANLASQAYGADPQTQQGLVQQAYAIDPEGGATLDKQAQGWEDKRTQTMLNMARMLTSVPQAQRAGIYRQMVPTLKTFGLSQLPEDYTPETAGIIDQTAQSLVDAWQQGSAGTVQSTYIDAQGNRVAILRDGTTRVLGANAPNNQIIDTGNGFYGVDKGNLQAAPVMIGGQQQAPQAPSGYVNTPSGPVNIDPSIPPEIRAQIAANPDQFTQGGVMQGAPVVQDGGGGQLRSTPKQANAFAPLTSDEVAQLGLPPGTFAQRDTVTGEIKFGPAGVQGPKPMSEYQRQQLQMKSGKAKAALSGTVADLERMGAAVRKVMNSPGLDRITGIMGALPNIPGSDAANAEADLDALKSQIAFAVLAKMRAMSPTGGALGSVSDAEGKRLEANLAALDKAQSADQMRARLQDILDYIESSNGNLQDAYNEQFGGQQSAAPQSPGGWSIQKVN